MTSRSLVSILCRANTSLSAWPKSPPTTATTRTSVKKLAEMEKCEAEPPSMRSRLPNGVSTASNATEPTTSNDMFDIFDLRLQISELDLDLILETANAGSRHSLLLLISHFSSLPFGPPRD